MTPTTPTTRRSYLGAVAAAGAVALAGCTGSARERNGSEPRTYLSDPDPQIASEDKAYPAWGQPIPDASIPAPLRDDESVSPAGFEGRDVLLTFFYSHCRTVCPRLVSTLRDVQTRAGTAGVEDEIALLAVTFDPERDTADRLREYGERMHVDRDAANWYFLRPAGPERAKEVVQETYGVGFTKTHPEDMDSYMFAHLGLILLANRRGIVERAYLTKDRIAAEVWADLETLRSREG